MSMGEIVFKVTVTAIKFHELFSIIGSLVSTEWKLEIIWIKGIKFELTVNKSKWMLL